MEIFLHIANNTESSDEIKGFLNSNDLRRISYLSNNNFIFESDDYPTDILKDLADTFGFDQLKCECLASDGSAVIDYQDGKINEFRSEAGQGNKIIINTKGNWAHKNKTLFTFDDLLSTAEELGLNRKDKSIER